ncbi:MAG: hypothetical protein LBT71_02360 [Azoarcus sp.]|jgi:hypothetical protein|nr:hypothetical protein [Azoarcus sp.]
MKRSIRWAFVLAFALLPAWGVQAQETQPPRREFRFNDIMRDVDLSFEVGGEQKQILRIYRKGTGQLVQNIETDCFDDRDFSDEESSPNFGVGDFNFDGIEDFSCQVMCGNANCGEMFYLYDPERQQFQPAFALSGYGMDFDPATKTITVGSRGGAAVHAKDVFRVEGFRLVPERACQQSIMPAAPDVGIGITLTGGDLALDVFFNDDPDTKDKASAFSGHVRFADTRGNLLRECGLRLKEKRILARNETGKPQSVDWTLDVLCGPKWFGTLSLVLADADNDLPGGHYRQAGDGKEIALEWGFFCRACNDGKDCETVSNQ